MAFAAEAFLEVEEVELSSLGEGDEFSVEDAGGGEGLRCGDDFGELAAEVAKVAGEEGGAFGGVMQLGADAVVLGFEMDGEGRVEAVEDGFGVGLGGGEHGREGGVDLKFGFVQFVLFRQLGGEGEVA